MLADLAASDIGNPATLVGMFAGAMLMLEVVKRLLPDHFLKKNGNGDKAESALVVAFNGRLDAMGKDLSDVRSDVRASVAVLTEQQKQTSREMREVAVRMERAAENTHAKANEIAARVTGWQGEHAELRERVNGTLPARIDSLRDRIESVEKAAGGTSR